MSTTINYRFSLKSFLRIDKMLVLLFSFTSFSYLFSQTTATFTTSSTWTCPIGVTSIKVEAWGGGGSGGGGGNSNADGGAGGGGGGYTLQSAVTVVPGTTYTITVGSSVAGVAQATDGSSGNPSSATFGGTTVTANGGGAGLKANGATVTGGSAGVGGTYNGGAGGTGVEGSHGGGGGEGAASNSNGQSGSAHTAGTSTSGGDGGAGTIANSGTGTDGTAPGGGGGGATRTGASSGAGARGQIVLTYTVPPLAGGTYTIGSSGDNFPTIASAISNIEAGGISGPIIFELQSDYVSGGSEALETYPLTFAAVSGASAVNTITYRPAAGVTALVSDGDPGSGADLFLLNGADRIIFDGRPGGVGTTVSDIQWTIRNTRTAATIGPTVALIADATNNTFRFLNIEGEASGFGIVFFETASAGGNDNNTFSYCKIQDRTDGSGTAALPDYGIRSVGTTGQANSTNTVDNCHFVDVYRADVGTGGVIQLSTANDSWTITNNHFYENTGTTLPTLSNGWSFIQAFTGGGYVITGNFMGGSAASCGGAAYTVSGSSFVYAIYVDAACTGSAITIKSNTIQNIAITTTNAILPFSAIHVLGSANIVLGAIGEGNTIGSTVATGSIAITNNTVSGSGGTNVVYVDASGTNSVAYNNIGGFTFSGTRTGTYNNMISIGSSAGTTTIDNNTVGGAVSNSIDVTVASYLVGIYSGKTAGISITNNTVRYFRNRGSVATFGVWNASGILTCTNNSISNFVTDGNAISYGIYAAGADVVTITGNSFQNFTLSNTGASCRLLPIYVGATSTATVSSNVIGSTTAGNMSCAGAQESYGIHLSGGTAFTVESNIIQGFSISNASSNFIGIGNFTGVFTSCSSNEIKNIVGAGDGTHYAIYHVPSTTSRGASITSNLINTWTLSNSASTFKAILVSSTGVSTINSNVIGSATNNNIVWAGNTNSIGIQKDGTGSFTIDNNTIQEVYGSSTGTSASFYGIYLSSGLAISVTGNTIQEIDTDGTGTSIILIGIAHLSATAGTHLLENNTIKNLNSLSTASNSNSVIGLYMSAGTGNAKRNLISGLTTRSTNAGVRISGVYLPSGAWSFHNNVIILNNGGYTNDVFIKGFFDISTSASNYYHNTVKVYGTSIGSSFTTCYFRNASTGADIVKNNVFQNLRTNSNEPTNSEPHYAMTFEASGRTAITTDYNYLETVDLTCAGYWVTDYTFANWKTAFAGEDNSVTGTTTIYSNGSVSTGFAGANLGENINATVSIDKTNTARNDGTPWMGAFESVVALPIQLASFAVNANGRNNDLSWLTYSELNNDFFTIEKTIDGQYFEIVGNENGAGTTLNISNYILTDYNVQPVINYYRLRQTDYDGKTVVSDLISIDNSQIESSKEVVLKTNILGQEVNDFYKGLVVIVYSDGSSVKVIQ